MASGIARVGSHTANFLFVVPGPNTLSVDPHSTFAKPWVALDVVGLDGSSVCRTVANPTAFSAGARHAEPAHLSDVWVAVDCGGTTYSARWDYRGSWLKSHPLHATHGQKAYVSSGGAGEAVTTTIWPQEQQTLAFSACAHGRACHGGAAFGDIVVSTTAMVTSATS